MSVAHEPKACNGHVKVTFDCTGRAADPAVQLARAQLAVQELQHHTASRNATNTDLGPLQKIKLLTCGVTEWRHGARRRPRWRGSRWWSPPQRPRSHPPAAAPGLQTGSLALRSCSRTWPGLLRLMYTVRAPAQDQIGADERQPPLSGSPRLGSASPHLLQDEVLVGRTIASGTIARERFTASVVFMLVTWSGGP